MSLQVETSFHVCETVTQVNYCSKVSEVPGGQRSKSFIGSLFGRRSRFAGLVLVDRRSGLKMYVRRCGDMSVNSGIR